jgi:aspartate carbamoyltransferase regulatory subunit
VLLAPTEQRLIFGWGVVAMITPARTVSIAHAFQVVRHAHFYSIRVVRHPVRCTRSLEDIPDSQIEIDKWLECLIERGRLALKCASHRVPST